MRAAGEGKVREDETRPARSRALWKPADGRKERPDTDELRQVQVQAPFGYGDEDTDTRRRWRVSQNRRCGRIISI